MTHDEIFTYENLYNAYLCARRGKRHKHYITEFECSLISNLRKLYNELKNRSYRPRPCKKFEIYCTAGQKKRMIHSPHFRDLVVQFCFYNAIYDFYDKKFIFDSYGCRKGKGAHRASARTMEFIRQSPEGSYYLQMDIKKYYYSIDHGILRQILARDIADPDVVDTAMLFCDIENPVRKGVNVGSLTAQLYGLIYLNRLDHFVKRVLKVKRYIRYCDDFLIFGLPKVVLRRMLEAIKSFAQKVLDLCLSKFHLHPLAHGVNFAGYRHWINGRIVRKKSLRNFKRALRRLDFLALQSMLAHASYTKNYVSFCKMIKNKTRLLDFIPIYIYRRLKNAHF